jgi:hypothetical protein
MANFPDWACGECAVMQDGDADRDIHNDQAICAKCVKKLGKKITRPEGIEAP